MINVGIGHGLIYGFSCYIDEETSRLFRLLLSLKNSVTSFPGCFIVKLLLVDSIWDGVSDLQENPGHHWGRKKTFFSRNKFAGVRQSFLAGKFGNCSPSFLVKCF